MILAREWWKSTNTGFRPDLGMVRGTSLDIDPALKCPRALAPLIAIAAYLAGNIEASRRVDLPETGVCSSNLSLAETASCCTPAVGCCPPAKTQVPEMAE